MKISFFLLLAIGTLAASTIFPASRLKPTHAEQTHALKVDQQADTNDLITFNANTRFPTIISELGPVLVNGNTVFQLDWFGQTVWSTNVLTELAATGHVAPDGSNAVMFGFPTGTALIGWIYSRITNKIYLHIPATRVGNSQDNDNWKYQYIVPLDPKTGKLEISTPDQTARIGVQGATSNGNQSNLRFQFGIMSRLGDGSIIVYGLLGTTGIANGGSSYFVFHPGTNKVVTGNRILNIPGDVWDYRVNDLYLHTTLPITTAPISQDKSLFLIRQVVNDPGKNSTNLWNYGRYKSNIFSLVVDNNFHLVSGNWDTTPIRWKPQDSNNFTHPHRDSSLVANNNYGLNNEYYDNKVTGETWLPFLDKLFVIKSDHSASGYQATTIALPKIRNADAPWNSGIIYSSYLDLRGDLFFNMATWDATTNDWIIDTTVYKLSATTKQITPYVTLTTSDNPDILNENQHFKIFAIPTQVGKIMLLNKKTGIAVAVDENPKHPGMGRIIGTLNGQHSFLKSPDFNLNLGARFKLPSQLQADNFTANGNGNIVNYDVTNLNDNDGSITVQATINYVPWFESQENNVNVKTTQITKRFTGLHTVNHLQFGDLNYQLKNARVDLITDAVLQKFDLLNLVDNGFNEQLRSKIKYQIQNVDKTSGSFEVHWTLADHVPAIDPRFNQKAVLTRTHKYQALPTTDTTGYQLGLINGSSVTAGTLTTVPTTRFSDLPRASQFLLKNITPSELARDQNKALDLLIDRTKLKGYPLYLMDVTLTPNDQAQTLDVEIKIPAAVNQLLNLNSQKEQILKTTYTGLAKSTPVVPRLNLNKFKTQTVTLKSIQVDLNQLNDDNIRSRLTSSLASQMSFANLWNQIFTHNDFNYQKVFEVSLVPDNIHGSLQIVLLNKSNFEFSLFKPTEPTGNITVIELTGFQKITPETYAQNQIQFAGIRDQNLLTLQVNKLASEVQVSDLHHLVTIGPAIKQQFPNFTLNDTNTKLTANDVSGQLSVAISLAQENTTRANQAQINLPNFYHHTFSDFARKDGTAKNFQPFSQAQLSKTIDLPNLTSQYIFNHQNEFILRSHGYSLVSPNQIEVVHSKALNAVFITYNFANQPEHQYDDVNHFSVVYRLS
ncbi:hypothetical protein J2Z62_000021 [Mycoplasmoides fastidiosum]|uniref:Lipoprotein-associated type-17 domain-containing protein n=1 Tax=Mycoplasmoides fastidiosum TaxID=92758 RepID=A0ABU0LYA5_9BACT|nr:lipoprotein 17-related variable surface protein [Mycoplasmoides fastidiosum]MDQ0513583.1 hypothetical protein [Mycoplasmoides fastidiosum]UUD37994.1 lipoprotein 17-related variable surface protein [Mycoplasmoides fastidiosum]